MEMQDTINALQRELAALGEKQPLIPEVKIKQHQNSKEIGNVRIYRIYNNVTFLQSAKDTPIMFSRLDSERNAKVMKRALNDERIDEGRYKDAVQTMDAYVEIPSKRLANLAQKYVHHVQMKEIEGM